ncbi:phospholipase B1, membrane-associated-like [Ischnura elegans]|uniref:phospholipase B1, membrane-associated-like n=1 Tax=Ischnura elegans TaxID=197161 RepID=UPI001ED88892|nr:phospholipase B1, membrane-associated-like [Ischnura elegans]
MDTVEGRRNRKPGLAKMVLMVFLLLPTVGFCRCPGDAKGLFSNRDVRTGGSRDGSLPPAFPTPDSSSVDCHDAEDESGNETTPEGRDGYGTIGGMVRVRAQKVMAVMREALSGVPEQIRQLPLLLGYFPGLKRTQEEIPASRRFPCPLESGAKSPTNPTSVHRLRPGDIRVIAAIGDSISTANGAMATSEDGLGVNFRGVSATGGGQGTWRQFLTLPNILKVFNPQLTGYATKTVKTALDPGANLNLAQNGALDEDLFLQAKLLVRKIKSDPSVDFRKDWKLVNILIGGNDICNEYCFVDSDKDSPEGHRRQLETTLDFLKANLPRTFINLIHVPNIVHLRFMKNIPLRCHIRRMIFCSCLFGGSDKGKADSVEKMTEGYWETERKVASLPKYETDEFAVVLQPFFDGLRPPPLVETRFGISPDLSYFAPDCFHFSQKGNAHMANALWNNMLEPIGNKSTPLEHNLLSTFHCPTRNAPYFFTARNTFNFLQSGHQ